MRPFPLKICAWLLVLLVAACAPVGPDYRPPQPDLPARWNGEQGHGPAAKVAGEGRWWGLFDDPLLNGLVDRAIAANHDLRIAGSRIKAARARQRMTAAASGPTLAAEASSSHSRRSDNTASTSANQSSQSSQSNQDLYQAGFDAGWEIDLFGGRRRAIEASAAALSATLETRRDVLISLEAEVARNYFELRGNRRRLATAQDNLAAQDKTLATVQGRFRLGLASELEVARTGTQQALLAAQIPSLKADIEGSIHALALLLNLQPADLGPRLVATSAPPVLPPALPAGLPSDLLRRRPDIRAAEFRLAAATAEVGVAVADLFPRFSLSALAGLQSGSLADLVDSGSRFWSFGPSLSLPLFNRDTLRAAVEIGEAEREEMLIAYEQTVLAALVETEDLLVTFAREQERRDHLALAARTGRQAVVLSEGLYKSGLADLTDVLASQRSLYQAEDQLIQSEQQLALTAIALYKALGGGWEIAERTAPAGSAESPPFRKPANNVNDDDIPRS